MVREFDEVIFKTGTVGKVFSFCVDTVWPFETYFYFSFSFLALWAVFT